MLLERNCSEEIIFEVKDLEHLKELMLDNKKLSTIFDEQEAVFEQIAEEIICTTFENIEGTESFELEENNLCVVKHEHN
jgi:hypothetical protein